MTRSYPAEAVADDSPLNLPNIQGLLLRGYKHFDYIRHLIFRIDSVAGAQKAFQALLPGGAGPLSITDSTTWPRTTAKPAYRLNLALTNTGLKQMIGAGAYQQIITNNLNLGTLFDNGAAADAAPVGDIGTNAPTEWWPRPGWQLPTPPDLDRDFDLAISLFARTPAGRDFYTTELLTMFPAGSATLTYRQDSDPLPEGAGRIHFGYQDGISQPRIAGAPSGTVTSAPPGAPPGAKLSLAEGDPDDRPVVPAWHFIISPDAERYNADPFLYDGSFGAFRVLYQDVAAFNRMIESVPGTDPELVAAKMCGRWRDGTPIEVSPAKMDPSLTGFELTNFDFLNSSANQAPPPAPAPAAWTPDEGPVCPYASHTRRSNPRDDVNVNGNAGTGNVFAEQHRILRRAHPYGPPYTGPDSEDRGLIGYFIGASIQEQFHFVMQTWVTGNNFAPLTDDTPNGGGYDPLFGPPPNQPALSYSFEYDGPNGIVETDQLQLVLTKGSLYVFFPSIEAMARMSRETE
jgi:deferrochelatase/peroxidase EfeB